LRMAWRDLLFAHWPVSAPTLRDLVPRTLDLDLWEGEAWVGVVPFRMADVAPRRVPAVPWLSAFPELNVRTYVRHGDKPGVWFFSLDAARWLAVRVARLGFGLPYFWASMSCDRDGDSIEYRSRRLRPRQPRADFAMSYRPIGAVFHAARGSLEHFLTERYCLYAQDRRGRVLRGDIHHEPWPLASAEAETRVDTMASAAGIELADTPPHLLFAHALDVVAWRNVPVE